ncbi:glycosyltransferase family 4 protein [Methyloceanibacter sp. wino2]|uniref:glycosyltransferase family 4 protein n=1 Tax=Methyloceanibacter sp. wino2 TaxID=2170729 RepID=UPI000D3E8ADC|nr:glycosyltransferase family 4 protein [Methyloceanibacter sp. wino2]
MPANATNGSCAQEEGPLSVLFFVHSANLGGAERCFLELLTYLRRDPGIACTVIAPSDGPLVSALQELGAQIIFEPALHRWAGKPNSPIGKKLVTGAHAFLRLLPTLREIDPDVIYTETSVIPWGAAAAALLDKPHMWSVTEFGELDHGLSFLGGHDAAIEQIKDGASFILTISEAVRKTLFPDLSPDRARTIYRHAAKPTAEAPATDFFRRPQAQHLAVFGTISEGKGQLDAVKAVLALTQRGRDVELVLAGYPGRHYVAEIEDFISQHELVDHVRIVDFIHDPYPAMLAADALLVCSRNEAFGRVVVDGMKLGRPVIYTASGGIPEMMRDGVTGLSYMPGNVEELADRIEELANDPARAAQIGAAAKRHADAMFVCNGNQILSVLRDLACAEPGTRRVSIPKNVVTAIVQGHAQLEGENADAKAEIRDQQDSLKGLRNQLKQTSASETDLRTRLEDITTSRSYALSLGVARIAKKLRSLFSW